MCISCAFFSCREEKPVLFSIEPRIGQTGEAITIYGDNLGDERVGSYITIAGTPPTASSYLSWRNDQIRIRTPEFSGSGLLYVHRNGKKSNPLLLANRASIPKLALETGGLPGPIIASVQPGSGSIGSLVTIEGYGFGSTRETGGVFFSWRSESLPGVHSAELQPETVEAFAGDFGYELWTDREIRVRVPDGAVSGVLEVRTPKKTSSPIAFTVSDKPGAKIFKEKRKYTIEYAVDIQVQSAEPPNTLYLWVPEPAVSASQRITDPLIFSRKPFADQYQGTALFQVSDLKSGEKVRITAAAAVEVYAVETSMKNQPLKPDADSPVHSVHTLPSALIPSDNPDVANLAKTLAGKEQNPYEKARKLYEWLITEVQYGPSENAALGALQERRGDAYAVSLLFCALSRAVDLPAIPVAGVLATKSLSAVRHYWAEFWVDGFGWIPVDPALGAGFCPEDFALPRDAQTYYFGSTDNQRIAFSRGQGMPAQMDPYGRTAVRRRDYALQSLWEEASGNLDAYSSLWSGIALTGVYSQ
ncbi:MAG: IPT/TIG domain-containing protein [Spirochaetaceae bacterium]|nr:IPT/TIG domain-containing protein [Spirochaetaceae bacterium]